MYMKLARWCFQNRWMVLIGWLIVIVGTNVAASLVGSGFDDSFEAPASEAADGIELLEDNFGGAGAGATGQIVIQAENGVEDPAVVDAVDQLMAKAEELDGVVATSPYEGSGAPQIAFQGEQAGKIAYVNLSAAPEVDQLEAGELGEEMLELGEELESEVDGLRVEIGGSFFASFEPPESEVIGLAFAIVILIVSFGSVLAMGLPIGVAISGVGVGIAISTMLSNVIGMPEFATIIGAMIGLGVGIDYALFIVTRYREGLDADLAPLPATVVAADTAGRAVIFAGVTVVVSLLGLLFIGLEFVAGLGVAAATTVLVTVLATTTLLPALLGFAQLRVEVTRWRGLIAAGLIAAALLGVGLGITPLLLGVPLAIVVLIASFVVEPLRREVPRREKRPIEESVWYRWSHQIQRRPWPFLLGGVALLLFLTVPLFSIRLAFTDEGNFAEETTTRQAYDLLAEGFGPGFNGPFSVVAAIDSPEELADFQAAVAAVGQADGVALASPAVPSADGTAAVAQVVAATSPQSAETESLVRRLRSEVIPGALPDGATVEPIVTGFVPMGIDFSSYMGERSLVFFGIVLVLSFLLLMAVFRSVLVPLKAVIMNSLSISGAYGIVVALFQWGHLSDITGIEPGPIEPFIPMMMFAIVFGLSMDYEVFLLSRVKEEYERTGDAQNSVADGLASTARVITAAAAIMVVVFGSFLLEDDRIPKVFGVGLGMAVLLDATLVRMLLVPATMELLGERNWWIPKWLDRIIPRLDVEGAPDHDEQLARIIAETEAAEAAEAKVPASV